MHLLIRYAVSGTDVVSAPTRRTTASGILISGTGAGAVVQALWSYVNRGTERGYAGTGDVMLLLAGVSLRSTGQVSTLPAQL
eukprot:525421-Rhodomonas_salina.5